MASCAKRTSQAYIVKVLLRSVARPTSTPRCGPRPVVNQMARQAFALATAPRRLLLALAYGAPTVTGHGAMSSTVCSPSIASEIE